MSLFEHHVEFISALRDAGLTVSVAEGLYAAAAIRSIELIDREGLRAAYAATLVKRQIHRDVFDAVFDVFYPPVVGDGVAGEGDSGLRTPTAPRPPPAPWEVDDPLRLRLREDLSEYLRTGDEQLAAQIARDAVAGFGAQPGSTPGQPSWSRVTVLDRLSPQTLMAGLLAQMLYGREQGGLAERVARATTNTRIDRFTSIVDGEVRRRTAEQTSAQQVARNAVRASIDRVAFLSANKTELAELRRQIQPLARRLAARLAAQHRHGRRGQLDFRRTVRSSLSFGGVPITTHHRPRRHTKTDLVILCDVSESVTSFAHFTLLLIFALREQFSRVRAFAFVDELDEITRFFAPGSDVLDAVTRLVDEARVTWLFGRTDYGRAFELFEQRYPDAIGRRASLLVLGDARSNYTDPGLAALTRLAGQARHAHWLNPERRQTWDTGDSVAEKFARIVPMVECRNLDQLGQFVRDLA